MAFDVSGLTPLDPRDLTPLGTGGTEGQGSAPKFDVTGLTPLDPGDLTPLGAEPAAPQPPEDSWLDLGRRVVENVPQMFKRAAGGLVQRLGETSPGVPGTAGMFFAPENDPDGAGREVAAQRERVAAGGGLAEVGREIATAAEQELQRNRPNVDPDSLKGYAYDIAAGIVNMAPAIAASLATRSPVAGMAIVGGQVYGDRYAESRADGRTPERAGADAVFYAAAEAIPEALPLSVLTKEGGRFLWRTLKAAGAEGVQEMFTEALQAGYDAGVLGENMTWGEAWDRIQRAGIVGAGVGGGLAVATHPFTRERAPQPTPDVAPPNVTADDVASPIPTDLISQGRATVDALIRGEPAPEPASGAAADATVPQGAVPAEVLLGRVEEVPVPAAPAPAPVEATPARPVVEQQDGGAVVAAPPAAEIEAPQRAQQQDGSVAAPAMPPATEPALPEARPVASAATPPAAANPPAVEPTAAPVQPEPRQDASQPAAPVSAPAPSDSGDAAPEPIPAGRYNLTLPEVEEAMKGRWLHRVPMSERRAIADRFGLTVDEFSRALDDVGYRAGERRVEARPAPTAPADQPAEAAPATAVPTAPILRKDGSPFGTAKAAELAARSRPDLKGRALVPVQVDGGWGLGERQDAQPEPAGVVAEPSPPPPARPDPAPLLPPEQRQQPDMLGRAPRRDSADALTDQARAYLEERRARGEADKDIADDLRVAVELGEARPFERRAFALLRLESMRGRRADARRAQEYERARSATTAPETPPAEQRQDRPGASSPAVTLSQRLSKSIRDGQPTTSADLQRQAEEAWGGTLASGAFDRQSMYEAMELALNRFVVERPPLRSDDIDLAGAIRRAGIIEDAITRVPTQTVRSAEKVAFQQFSTPPHYAYAAVWAANIRPGDVMLEPSAGTGSLVAPAINSGATVIANELSPRRAELLKSLGVSRVFTENAEQLDNILPLDVRPTLVVMNPPFSQTAGRMGDKKVLETGAVHIEQALKRLEPGGRLVAIVGRGMSMDADRFRAWWRKIGQQHTVRANIGVDGGVYSKYGTSFATRLLVIDKVAPQGDAAPVLGEAGTIPELLTLLEGVRNARSTREPVAGQSGRAAVVDGGEGAGRGAAPAVPPATDGVGVRDGGSGSGTDRADAPRRPAGKRGAPTRAADGPGQGDAVPAGQPGRPGGSDGAGVDAPVGADAGGNAAGGSSGGDGVVREPDAGDGPVLQTGGQPDGLTVETAEPSAAAGALTEAVYERYEPQRMRVPGARPHPGELVQSAAMASVLPPKPTYSPSLPPRIVSEGLLSVAQLEAVVYAGQAHQQTLPASDGAPVFRRGFFIGDGTGVGKGREVAGILLDNWEQGRRRAVWVSEKKTLLEDARRDWSGLGGDGKAISDLGKVKAGTPIQITEGIMFSTYDTLKGAERSSEKDPKTGKAKRGKSRVDQIVEWLGPDFDGVIAFDEAHNLGNSVQTMGKRGMTDVSQKALAGVELQKRLPNARVVYVSATGATEVSNLAYADRLGLWGRGTPFADKREFISKVESGGIAAMELVARDLKQLGLYIARSLSFSGTEQTRLEHALAPHQREIYDALAEGWQLVLQNINRALEATKANINSRAKSAALSAFWGTHQRFFNQIITSMQMPSVLQAVERDLAEGRQVVMQLVNTNEASQERALAKLEEGDDLDDLDMTPRDQLLQMIERSFPVQQFEEYVDENNNVRSRPVLDSAGNPVESREAVAMRDGLIDKLGSIRVPEGPLEMVLNKFGVDQVAEATGRSRRVVRKPDDSGVMRTVVEARPASANITETKAFQDGRKRIMVFSDAGGTGRSYHADNAAASRDRRRVHYLIQAGWRADKAIQGFGRTHRTNQASAPVYVLVHTDLMGQKRFISSIARRMSQLGALTKGERKTGDAGLFSARDNLESREAKDALTAFFRDLARGGVPRVTLAEFEEQTGLRLTDDATGALRNETPEITTFLNRLLSLKIETQNAVFDAFMQRLDSAVDAATAAGTLDVGVETVTADSIVKAGEEVVHTDERSGAETRYVRLVKKTTNKPATWATISAGRARGQNGKPDFFVRSTQSDKVYAVHKANSKTADDGRIVDQVRLVDPVDSRFIDRSRLSDGRYWERLEDQASAKAAWEAALAKLPKFAEEDIHLITGAVLPIWDRLRGNPRIYRLQTDDGERLLGRVIPEQGIGETLRALGAGKSQSLDPETVARRVLERGDRAEMTNGWALKRSRVAGEWRIEIVGPDYREADRLARDGVFSERISYQTRYFVPTGDRAPAVIKAITEGRPIVSVQASDAGERLQVGAASLRLAPAFEQALPAIEADLQAKLERLGIADRVAVRFVDAIRTRRPIGDLPAGTPIPLATGRYHQRLIEVALGSRDRMRTLGHEAIHAMRDIGVFRDAEWRTLERAARSQVDRMRGDYDLMAGAGFADRLTEAEMVEEAVAEMFGEWLSGQQQRGFIRTAFERIRDFLRALGQVLRGHGFRTYESVFRAIESGEIGGRREGATPMREAPAFMFAGTRAGGANITRLGEAQRMEEDGAPMPAIRRQTGWFKGRDGQWRFEIDDRGSRVLNFNRDFQPSTGTFLISGPPLSTAFDHPALFAAYPELRDIIFMGARGPMRGSTIGGTSILARAETEADARQVILHELQHVVQRLEGFAAGANPAAGERAYLDSIGEREARDVQIRRDMANEERAATDPEALAAAPPRRMRARVTYSDPDQDALRAFAEQIVDHPDAAAEFGLDPVDRDENVEAVMGDLATYLTDPAMSLQDLDYSFPELWPDGAETKRQLAEAVGSAPIDGDARDRLQLQPRDTDPDAPGGAAVRQRVALFEAVRQPLDRAARIPFDIFGGLDERGQWKPGLYLTDRAANVITKAEFSDTGPFAFINTGLRKARAGLIDRYGLDDAYVERERVRGLDERRIAAQVPEILERLKAQGVAPEEMATLHAVLTGEEVADARWSEIAGPIREAIDQMGAEAVSLGLLSAESYERNRGKYLHRVYEKHESDQGRLAAWVTRLMAGRRRKIIGDQFKGRGMWLEVPPAKLFEGTDDTWDSRIDPERAGPPKGTRVVVLELAEADPDAPESRRKVLRRTFALEDRYDAADFEGYENRGTWEVRGTKGGKVVLWRDFTREERRQMGEIVDARYTVAKTFMLMAHDLATGRFFKDIASNEAWSRDAAPAEGTWKEAGEYNRFWADPAVKWVKVPDATIPKSQTKRYGALAGRYVRAEIWRDMAELEAMQKPGLWDALLRQWKLNKTARSPVVHMNNVMSNLMFMDMADVRLGDLTAAIRSMAKGDEAYREAVDNGAFGTDMVAAELRRDVLAPVLDEIQRQGQGGQGALEARLGMLGKLADRLFAGVKAADDAMLKAYQMEDEVFRMALFLRRRGQGVDAQAAALEARDQFMNYDIRAPWINAARRTVLPFLAYTYRAIPLVAKTAATKPWKMAKYFTVAYATQALAYALMGDDEDDQDRQRRSMREQEQGYTWIGVERMFRLPANDGQGNPLYLDIRRWIPAGDVFDLGQGSSVVPLPSWLQMGGPLQIGMEMMLNRSAFTGRDIVNRYTDTTGDRLAKAADYLYKAWMPSAAYIPGSWYWERVGNAVEGARDWQGRPYSVPQALASSVGVKVKSQDPDEGFVVWAREFDRIERELKDEAKRTGRDRERGLISEKAYERAMARSLEKLERLNERRREVFVGGR